MYYIFDIPELTISKVFRLKNGSYKADIKNKETLPFYLFKKIRGLDKNNIIISSDDFVELKHPNFNFKMVLTLEGNIIELRRSKKS